MKEHFEVMQKQLEQTLTHYIEEINQSKNINSINNIIDDLEDSLSIYKNVVKTLVELQK